MTPLHETAHRRADQPVETTGILDARSLHTSHRRLAELLRPGLAVLDVGCGTGAITRGIAEAVGPYGRAVGVDVSPELIVKARQLHGEVPGLAFEVADVYHLAYQEAFDIVTAARVLQWLADPLAALRKMVTATKPGGRVVVLDYNHEKIRWEPDPPASMQVFYAAFLKWRADAGMDNAVADRLPELFAAAGLKGVAVTPQHEVTRWSDTDFAKRIGIWAEVAASRGHQMVRDGYLTEAQRQAAEADYRAWIEESASSQAMYLLAVEGVRP